jgi:hypothetical protein
MEELIARTGCRGLQARNCIEMLLGDKMEAMDKEARTFYLYCQGRTEQKMFLAALTA